MTLEILLVEDSDAQAQLVRQALKLWKTPYNLHVTGSAEDALEFLNHSDGYANSPRPHLALIDLSLPKQPGFAVLEAIRQRPDLSGAVVIILSTSIAECDVKRAFPMAAAYLQKPLEWPDMMRLFEALETFWRMDVRFSNQLAGAS